MLDVGGAERHAEQQGHEPLFFSPFVSSPMRIDPAWIDYNGHLNLAYHGVLFDRAMDEAFALCGLGPDYIKARGGSFFLVESRIRYRRELSLKDTVRATLQLLAVDDKRIHYTMALRHAREGWTATEAEHLSLHVNMLTRRAAPFPADIRASLEAMQRAHAALPAPEWSGEGVSLPRKALTH